MTTVTPAEIPDGVLRIERVGKSLGGSQVLSDVSLDIRHGEILALLGPSGCGKTTTLRILAGLETPDSGAVYFREQPLVSVAAGIFVPPHRRDFGMVFQSYAVWPHMSVFENVAYPLRVRHTKRGRIRERVMRSLELVGMEHLEKRQAPQLSGGEQQRVALARALVYEPEVLLLDEPFSNLDARLREQMRMQMRVLLTRLADLTVVFVTHDQTEALSLSDRCAVMERGHIQQIGIPNELYDQPATPFVRDFVGHTIALPGTVTDLGSDATVTMKLRDVPGGVVVGTGAPNRLLGLGAEACAYARPAFLRLRRAQGAAGGPNALPGVVQTVLFSGDSQDCRITLGAREDVRVQVPRFEPVAPGDEVLLEVDQRGITVWPA